MKKIFAVLMFLSSIASAAVPYWRPPMVSSSTAYGTGYLTGLLQIYDSTSTLAANYSIMLNGLTGEISASTFTGSGSGLTSIPAAELVGTVPTSSVDLSTVTTRFLAVEASTGANAANIAINAADIYALELSTAPLANASNWDEAYSWGDHALVGYLTAETDPIVGAISGIVKADGGGNISAATAGTDYLAPDGDGSALTGVIHATTTYLADGVSLTLTGSTFSAKSSSVTLQGNTFNGSNQLVLLDGNGKLPAVDGSALVNLPEASGGAVLASTQTFTGANTFTNSINMNQVYISSASTGRHAFGGVTRETWYKNPSFSMELPVGTWDLSFQASIYMGRSASTAGHLTSVICLSTSTVAGTGLLDCNVDIALAPNQEFNIYSVNIRQVYVASENKTIYIHGAINNYSGANADPSGFDIYSIAGIRNRTARIEAVKIRD